MKYSNPIVILLFLINKCQYQHKNNSSFSLLYLLWILTRHPIGSQKVAACGRDPKLSDVWWWPCLVQYSWSQARSCRYSGWRAVLDSSTSINSLNILINHLINLINHLINLINELNNLIKQLITLINLINVSHLINLINQWIELIHHLINKLNQLLNQSNQPIHRPMNQPVNQIKQPIIQINQ